MTTWSPLDEIPAEVRARAARVRLACFDVDGVMTDGGLYYSDAGQEAKRFHVLDGLGLKMLLAAGVEVAVITARDTPAVKQRMHDLGITRVHVGVSDKRACMQGIADALDIALDEVLHVGDDLPDLGLMSAVGFAVTVANAHPVVAARAHWRTTKRGGEGAVREVCELVLAARGQYEDALARFRS